MGQLIISLADYRIQYSVIGIKCFNKEIENAACNLQNLNK